MQFVRNDIEVTVTLPKEHRGCFTSKFWYDEIETIAITNNNNNQHQRIWIGILKRSLSENIVIHKNKPFGFFPIEPETNINIKYETAAAKNKDKTNNNSKKNSKKKKKPQSGGFLNKYDFAYARRNVVNQLGRVAPGVQLRNQ